MKKRLWSAILSLCLLLTMVPTTAFAVNQDGASKTIALQYDDYYTAEGDVAITNVGTDVATDATGNVLALDGNTIHAIGLGDAEVTINGEIYTVTVTKAKVNIVLVGGQSNATGEYNGNYLVDKQSEFDVKPAECDKGTAYLWRKSATEPAQLTGMLGRGWRSSLAKELYAETGVKTAIVYDNPLTARPGANINEWQDDNTTSNPDVAISASMVQNCHDYFANSAYYDVESCGLYWLQGEANASNDPDTYYTAFMSMYNELKAASPVDYCAFLRVRRTTQTGIDYMGPVIAQFQMANDHADMFMATTLTENWVDSDYNTQITVDTSKYQSIDGDSETQEYYKLFGGIHYYQRGYNFIGADAAYQMTKATSSAPENAIIMGDTTGKNNVTLALGSTVEKTKDETTAATKNFMFYAAPGSEASTVAVKVESDGVDITNRVVASTGSSAYLVNMAALKLCKDPVVTATMKNSAGADLGSVQVKFTTGVAVTPEPGDDSTTEGIYYHWDFTDKSTYLAGVEENGDTSTTAPMQIKTAADSGAKGYLIYQGSTNEALSYSSTNGLVRSDAIRDTDSLEYDKAFVINNNQMDQGITVTLENGFLIEFTASTSNDNDNSIVLGKGSVFAPSGGHPLLYFSNNNMTLFSPEWRFTASNAATNRKKLSTYRFLYDGDKLHLTVIDTQSNKTEFDNDVTVTGNIADWTINYLFPTFSTNSTNKDKSYLFAGNITDLKIATDAYKTLTITNQDGIDDSFEIVGVTNGQKIPTFENTTFRINTKNNSELTNVSAENATLTYNPDTLTYTLNNITGDVTLNIQTQVNYHNWVEVSRTEPTCTETGSVSYKCSDEGCLATKQETLPALGHKWDEGTVVTAPSGTTDGTLRYTCLTCHATKDEKIPATSNYYHWDFTDKDAYVSGLNGDGTTSTEEQMKIKSASDSPERYWVYSVQAGTTWTTNDTLSYSEDKGLTRTGNSNNTFKLQDANGNTSVINMTETNGFKLEMTLQFTDPSRTYDFVLGKVDGNSPPWFYRESNQLKLGNYQKYIQHEAVVDAMTTYTYSYDGKNTYHIRIAQGENVIFDQDVELTNKHNDFSDYPWQILMPYFAGNNTYAFNGSIKDLKIWTSTNYDVTTTADHASTDIASDATIGADATLKFTVTPDAGYHVTNVTTNSGVVTKNDDGTYTLSYVTDNAVITVKTEQHTLVKTAAKAATYTEAGNNEYYTCKNCNKVFKDELGTQETTVEAETIAKLTRPSSGGSSSSSSTTNTVSASTASNGKVSLDKSTAKKGDTVTVTVTPDAGYQLDKLPVTDAKGNTIAVAKKGDNQYTFTMPDSKVTITPTFSKIEDTKPSKNGFVDVASSAWYADEVQYVTDKGLMNGTGDNQFSPNASTTRGMLMTVLARYAGEDTAGGATWYEKGMNWAKAKGVSDGTNPTVNITREQLVTMLYRYAGSPAANGSLNSFSDAASVNSYAVNAMQWAVANGIVNGSNGKLNPQNNATRAQVAAILMRFCEMSK